jgi:hypothetical protein
VSATHQPGAYRRQDGQAVFALRRTGGRLDDASRAQRQWDRRCPPEWRGYPVRYAWREGTPIDAYGRGGYARDHEPSGMRLVAAWGFLKTAIRMDWDQTADGHDSTATHGGDA